MSLPATNDFDEPQELALYHSFPIGFPSQAWFPCTNLSCWRKSFSNSLPSQRPSFPALVPLYPAPFSAMSFPWKPGSSSRSHQMLRQVDQNQNPNPNYSVLHKQVADWKQTQSGVSKRVSVHESPLPSSITLRSGCLLSVSSHMKWGQINTPQSASFTGLFEYQIIFYMWKCFEKYQSLYTYNP